MKLCEVRDECQDCGHKEILEPHYTFGPDPKDPCNKKIESMNIFVRIVIKQDIRILMERFGTISRI